MKNRGPILVVICVISLVVGCSRSDPTATALPTHIPQSTYTQEAALALDQPTIDVTPACQPASGGGTVPPAISIYSVVFVVNGSEQVVRDGDMLQVLPGEEVYIREVIICVGSFSDSGGEACVDFAPTTQNGQEVVSDHRGTHAVRVSPGFMTLSGPDQGWTIDEDWTQINVVLNHWPTEGTEDFDCGSGRCERDDQIIVWLR